MVRSSTFPFRMLYDFLARQLCSCRNSSVLQCLSRWFLNELALGAVTTTSIFFLFLTIVQQFQTMTPCSFPCITVFVQLDNVKYITVIFLLKQFIYLNHITMSSSICKCGKFQSLKSFLIRNILHTRKLLCLCTFPMASLYFCL